MSLHREFLRSSLKNFSAYKVLAEKAFDQINESDFYYIPDAESNSIAILIQHLAGNMKSRFTDFLTSDGEKPNRFRDQEFENKNLTKAELLLLWQQGWQTVFDAIQELTDEEMEQTIVIRHETLSVVDAIIRQVAHYASHVGQIVYIAKHIRQTKWQTLSVPKGKSEEYNQQMINKLKLSSE